MQHQLPTIQQANNLPIGVPQLGGNKNIPRDPRPRRYGAVRFNLRHLWHQRCFRGRELHHLSGVSGRSGATNGWREVTVTKLHIHHGWWTANPTSPRFSWINIAIWCDMNIAKCFIEKCLRHPMTLHGGFHACAVSSPGFQQVDDWLTWLAMQQVWCWILRITTTTNRPSKAKVETFNITQRKGIHWKWYLALRPGPCVFAPWCCFDPLFFWHHQRYMKSPASFVKKTRGFWQISDREVDEIPEVLELVRGVSWKTLRWVVGLMVEIKHPAPREKWGVYMGLMIKGTILRVTTIFLWCT